MYSVYKRILCIKYLPDDTDATINTLFSKFGKIISHIFIPTTDPWKKDAVVELESEHLAIQARRELHGKVFYDSKLYVDFASTQEAQTLVNSTLERTQPKTSVLDRIVTQKDLKEPKKILENLSEEGGLNILSTTPEILAEKPQTQEMSIGKRNLEERIERDNEKLLEKDNKNYEEMKKKIKVDSSPSRDLKVLDEGSSIFPQQQLDSVHEAHDTNVSNSKLNEEILNDKTCENHQVKVENKNQASPSANDKTITEKKEGGDDAIETLLANNPELKTQIGNPGILKALFDVFRQEMSSLINKKSAEKETSEVKKEHGSSRSKRRSHSKSGESSESSSSHHRRRSRRKKRSYSKSRSPRRSDRKKSRRSHSKSKSSSPSSSRHRSEHSRTRKHKRSGHKHRRDRDYSSSESSSRSESRSRSRSHRHKHKEKRNSRSRSGRTSVNKSELPAFDEKLLFEKFEQITKQYVSQKGVEQKTETAEDKTVNQLDPMQVESTDQIPQATNILADSNISDAPDDNSLKVGHGHHRVSTPEKQTPEVKSQQEEAQNQENHTKEKMSEAKSNNTNPYTRQESGFKYSAINQPNVEPENKSSPEKLIVIQNDDTQVMKETSPIKKLQERQKFIYSGFIMENRRQNLTLKLDKSSKPIVSFKEMYFSSLKNLNQQQCRASFEEASISTSAPTDSSNTNLQNNQAKAPTDNTSAHTNPNLVSHLTQERIEEEEQKANKEAGLNFIRLLHKQEELVEEASKSKKKKKKKKKGGQEANLEETQQNESDNTDTDLRTKHENKQGYDLRQALNQMRQEAEGEPHKIISNKEPVMHQITKLRQENDESGVLEHNSLINNDFIKKNNLKGFVNYFMTGGDVNTLKEKLKTLAKPN